LSEADRKKMADLRAAIQKAQGADRDKLQKEMTDLLAKLGLSAGQGRGQGRGGEGGGFPGGGGRRGGRGGGGADTGLTGLEQLEAMVKRGVVSAGFTEEDRKGAKLPLPPEQDSQVQVLLRPGLLADVEIQVEKLPDVIHVPAQAVFQKNGQYLVYVQKNGKFEARPVKLVKQSESMMVIESGVTAGEVVAMADPSPDKKNKAGEKKGGGAGAAMSGMGGGK